MSKKAISAYRSFAIINTVFAYYNMKDFGDKLCEVFDEEKKDMKVAEARECSVVLKRDRSQTITELEIKEAIQKALRDLIEKGDDIETRISDMYDFDYKPSDIDLDFVDEEFDIRISGRNIIIDSER